MITQAECITIERTIIVAPRRSQRVLQVASMFGIDVDDDATVNLLPECEVPLPESGVVFVTGPSGSGKSTILDCLQRALPAERVLNPCDTREIPDRPLVDLFDCPLESALSILSRAGLGDARLLVRPPGALSDGERARLCLALVMAEAQRTSRPRVILIDEFLATIDRPAAGVIAAGFRKWVARTAHTAVLATTHDDLLEPLDPEVLVYKPLDGLAEIVFRKSEQRP